MNASDRPVDAARKALVHVLDLVAADRVLVLTDRATEAVGAAYREAARVVGCDADVHVLPESGRPLQEIPPGLVDRLEGVTVVINAIVGDTDEIPFRVQWMKACGDRGIRVGHSPGITMDMLEGGSLDVDYAAMMATARRLIDAFAGVDAVHVTTAAGTDLTLGVAGRTFVTDVKVMDEKAVNLPCGEVYCCPEESRADGVLVVDGCVGGEGNVSEPVVLEVAGGRITGISCADPGWEKRVRGFCDTDEGARTIAELSIGMNPGARLAGCMLEDEKALHTAHVAFGGNRGMPGGLSFSRIHIDYLVHRPSLTAVLPDGSAREVMRDGDFLV